MKTLRDIVETHPEWLDLPVVVYQSDGTYDWLDGSAAVYVAEAVEREKCP